MEDKPKRWEWEEYSKKVHYLKYLGDVIAISAREALHANEPLIDWQEEQVKELAEKNLVYLKISKSASERYGGAIKRIKELELALKWYADPQTYLIADDVDGIPRYSWDLKAREVLKITDE